MALRALGCLLYSKNNRSNWEHIRDSETWQLTNTSPSLEILHSLRISYDLMPSYLKKCFAYCSIFPKNHKFDNIELIKLWISNGFIQSSRNNQEPEEIGQQYLEELLSRSFFIVLKDKYPFLTFEMHDLIYELAISVAQTESFNMKVWTQDISPTIRHVSFPDPFYASEDELSGCFNKLSRIHTIMCQGLESSDSEFFLETCILRFKHLRVLWLEHSRFDLLPSSIGDLKHLRYLSLFGGTIKKLPKSFYELRNLLFLNLAGCENLEELSADIKNMINIRALHITTKQKHFPESIGHMTSLRQLIIARCGNLEALFDDILLTSLRMLGIGECPKLASLGIKNLKALEDLFIYKCESLRLSEGDSNELGSLSSLQFLVLSSQPELVSLPGWLKGSASTLRMIYIYDCPKLSALPEWLQNCSSLTKLELEGLPELSSLPDGVRLIPTLKISECKRLSS
ncbi:putative disease resistance protein RGA3 [Eucalyptus grandis]|uniref:putative disease resistance protein RGA3 n=1 Tax=Eucalyptus grandis TaxID=71139 RepID=UPI00192E9C93|nr:putative disease resistance protein RGA3 [Eucalyptus grandis]